MRNTLINYLLKKAEEDEKLVLLTGDLGFSFLEPFAKKFPKRYYNMGVAEQNMIGVAAGLSLAGYNVFVYSISPFVTARVFEQIKLDLCYHNLNVKIIGVGGGFAYAKSGTTHHSFEDFAIMSSLQRVSIFNPASGKELLACLKATEKSMNPSYIRVGKKDVDVDYLTSMQLRKPLLVRKGEKGCILATGPILQLALDVALEDDSLAVYSVPSLTSIDNVAIASMFEKYDFMITLEEHVALGGLGSRITKIKVDENILGLLKCVCATNPYINIIGSHDYILSKAGLSRDVLKKTISQCNNR